MSHPAKTASLLFRCQTQCDLAFDHFLTAQSLHVGTHLIEQIHGGADGAKRVAQFVSEHGEEFVFRSVARPLLLLLGPLPAPWLHVLDRPDLGLALEFRPVNPMQLHELVRYGIGLFLRPRLDQCIAADDLFGFRKRTSVTCSCRRSTGSGKPARSA